MAKGLPDKLIAAHLCISIHTAKVHGQNIREKLNCKNRVEVVIKVLSGEYTRRNP